MAKTIPTNKKKTKRNKAGKIIVLTGGTTGDFKTAERKPSLVNFLNPFFDLVVKLNLNCSGSVYIATPVYHGFGIATVFLSLAIGSKLFLLQKFDKHKACGLVSKHKIEIVTLVPLMLSRMIGHNVEALRSLRCIISGGALLDAKLVKETQDKLGPVLFNLYGTSEAGVSVIATPADLQHVSGTLGKEMSGITLKILDANNKEITNGSIGRICIKSKWTVKSTDNNMIETGDLGYKDAAGYYYLCGKVDDMIVSGGENVYPVELENILIRHSNIKKVAVIGISDEEFGQRLKAFVVPDSNSNILKEELYHWLSTRAARYQIPKHIEFLDDLPYTALGKPDKKMLF